MKNKSFLIAFALVTSLFFLWAFLHNINPILIPHLKKACRLTDTESAFIDSSVYLGYFLIALPAGWTMFKLGYQKGILIGLFLYCLGAFLFVPAAAARSYNFFLAALFVMAAGATFLETIANPYITKLGDPASAAGRLNLAQSFNGVGAFIAPLIGGKFILSGIELGQQEISSMSDQAMNAYLSFEANAVKLPYIIIGAVVLVILLLFAFIRLPDIKEQTTEPSGNSNAFSLRVFRHRHFTAAVLAQFFYVGAQVGIGSFFIRFARYTMQMPEKEAAYWWGAVAMVGFMAGRFAGTALMRFIRPAALLAGYAGISTLLLLLAVQASGHLAVYALVAVPFFMSVMFPTIFALGIDGLGEESKIASSFLVMSIVGGALFPLMMGFISDRSGGNIQLGYVVPLICFIVVAVFGWSQWRRAGVSLVAGH